MTSWGAPVVQVIADAAQMHATYPPKPCIDRARSDVWLRADQTKRALDLLAKERRSCQPVPRPPFGRLGYLTPGSRCDMDS